MNTLYRISLCLLLICSLPLQASSHGTTVERSDSNTPLHLSETSLLINKIKDFFCSLNQRSLESEGEHASREKSTAHAQTYTLSLSLPLDEGAPPVNNRPSFPTRFISVATKEDIIIVSGCLSVALWAQCCL